MSFNKIKEFCSMLTHTHTHTETYFTINVILYLFNNILGNMFFFFFYPRLNPPHKFEIIKFLNAAENFVRIDLSTCWCSLFKGLWEMGTSPVASDITIGQNKGVAPNFIKTPAWRIESFCIDFSGVRDGVYSHSQILGE